MTLVEVSFAQGNYGALGFYQPWEELWGGISGAGMGDGRVLLHQYSRLLGSTLAEVKNLPWVEIPHEGLDDLGSLWGEERLQVTGSSQWMAEEGDRPRQCCSQGIQAKPGLGGRCQAPSWHCRGCLASSAAETSPKLWRDLSSQMAMPSQSFLLREMQDMAIPDCHRSWGSQTPARAS